jgi:hypothetical protein
MKKIELFILTGFLFFNSCNNSNTSKKDNNNTGRVVELPYIVDLEKNLNNVKSIPISSIGKEVEYIPLETRPNSMLSKIVKIGFCNSYIFISDFDKLLQFERTVYLRQYRYTHY